MSSGSWQASDRPPLERGGQLRIDVAWVPGELSGTARPPAASAVIDAIRATTSITTALSVGARRVIPVANVDEARALAILEGALLCGERHGLPPEGFDLGNSPSAYTADRVADRVLVFTTSNGTAAMRTTLETGPHTVLLACFRNLDSVAHALLAAAGFDSDGTVRLVCAGRRDRVSMDDAWCAGHLVSRLIGLERGTLLTDGAWVALELAERLGDPTTEGLLRTAAGRSLADAGLERDLADCARIDDLDFAPIWNDGAFVKGGGEEVS